MGTGLEGTGVQSAENSLECLRFNSAYSDRRASKMAPIIKYQGSAIILSTKVTPFMNCPIFFRIKCMDILLKSKNFRGNAVQVYKKAKGGQW